MTATATTTASEHSAKRSKQVTAAAGSPKESRSNRIPKYAAAFSDMQRAVLEATFGMDPLPTAESKAQIALQLGLPLKSVQVWFQNQRSKMRKREKKRAAREEARRQAAVSKPRFVFHNLKAQAKPNGFLQQFIDVPI